ncbi:hypothetical protein BCR44DRAFT_130776 [Catenaria anguillulae PL171]|uniref:Outer dynein arm-docking complex subunit 4 n=1 Tax=Catenaria anguillulae PL171 TaxID=765915 RepID=A0A1Y2HGC5_9FUNG|nr:hypothetical protein BCR44DRAFT_130776 [Catenaria anguillulae PL171]
MPAAVEQAGRQQEFEGDGSEVEGPVSSFQSYAAEGDILAKQGEYRKAIEAYTKALNMRPTEKNCLVARSKCYLQLGDADMALQDAETALKEDAEFFKGMYQKAEALYAKGDFEMALVYYHRGNKLRPELDEFRLGIQKAREAIDNSIGNPRDYKFKAPANFSLDASKRQTTPVAARAIAKRSAKPDRSSTSTTTPGGGTSSLSPTTAPHGVTVSTVNNTKKVIPRGESAQAPPPERDQKQLLGELYADKEYLEQLLNDRDFINNPNDRILDLVTDALKYLETRTEFWRQQKPIYARRKEAQAIRTKMASARNRQLQREKEREKEASGKSAPTSPTPGGGAAAAAATGSAGKPSAPRPLRAHVASVMGNAALEVKNYPEAEKRYKQVLAIKSITPEVQSVTYGHIGRAYAKQGKFADAAKCWEQKLATPFPLTPVERAWLYHDMARCFIEMGQDEDARKNAQLSCQFANEANEQRWILNAHVLLGQVFAKTDPARARLGYETALKTAVALKEENAIVAIKKALEALPPRPASAALAPAAASKPASASSSKRPSEQIGGAAAPVASEGEPQVADKQEPVVDGSQSHSQMQEPMTQGQEQQAQE